MHTFGDSSCSTQVSKHAAEILQNAGGWGDWRGGEMSELQVFTMPSFHVVAICVLERQVRVVPGYGRR